MQTTTITTTNKALVPITWGRRHESFSAFPRSQMPSHHTYHNLSCLSVLPTSGLHLAVAWLRLISLYFLTRAPRGLCCTASGCNTCKNCMDLCWLLTWSHCCSERHWYSGRSCNHTHYSALEKEFHSENQTILGFCILLIILILNIFRLHQQIDLLLNFWEVTYLPWSDVFGQLVLSSSFNAKI